MNKDLEDFKSWVNATSMQLDRVRISFAEHLKFLGKKDFTTPSTTSPYLTEFSRTSSQLWADIHFLYIALNHLVVCSELKGAKRVLVNIPFDKELKEVIEKLRHIFEHWDKTRVTFERNLDKKKAAKWYEDNYPDKNPWSLSLDTNGFVVSGILDINSVQTIVSQLEYDLIKAA